MAPTHTINEIGTPRLRGVIAIEFGLTAEAATALTEAAADRGLPMPEIARRLVEAAAADGLIDAILDDGKGRRS